MRRWNRPGHFMGKIILLEGLKSGENCSHPSCKDPHVHIVQACKACQQVHLHLLPTDYHVHSHLMGNHHHHFLALQGALYAMVIWHISRHQIFEIFTQPRTSVAIIVTITVANDVIVTSATRSPSCCPQPPIQPARLSL